MEDQTTTTLPVGWKETTLGEVVEFQRGFDLPTQNRTAGKYPLVVSNGIDGFVDEYKVKGPGVVTGRSGTLGKVFFIKDNFWPLNTTLWVKDFKGNNEKFIYYWLLDFPFDKFNAGTGVPTLNRNHIHEVDVTLPKNETEQQAIAAVLSSFDDKIELLQAQNKTLENIAQLLFKHWFVDFEFPDKSGKSYKSSGGRMIDSEMGEIPEGWGTMTVEEFTSKITKGTTPTSIGGSFSKEGINFIKAESITDDHAFDTAKVSHIDAQTNQLLSRSVIEDEDLLYSIAGTIGRFAVVQKTILPANTNQAVAIIRVNKEISDPFYLQCSFLLRSVREKLHGKVVEAVQANLSLTSLRECKIIMPDRSGFKLFKDTIRPLFDKIMSNNPQIQNLSKIREALLPKLIKGEIRVKGYE